MNYIIVHKATEYRYSRTIINTVMGNGKVIILYCGLPLYNYLYCNGRTFPRHILKLA